MAFFNVIASLQFNVVAAAALPIQPNERLQCNFGILMPANVESRHFPPRTYKAC